MVEERRTTINTKKSQCWIRVPHEQFCMPQRPKVTGQLTRPNIIRVSYPPYSPELSLYDFWLFGFLKESMKGKS
jgi:hypothetical protein